MALDGSPLLYFRLLSAPEANHLYLQFHHIMFDGASVRILLREIDKFYQGKTVDNEPFSSILPAFFKLDGEMTVGELCHQAETITEARQHEVFSYTDFCSDQGVQPHQMFVFQGKLFRDMKLGNETVTIEQLADNTTNEPLEIQLFQTEEGYRMLFSYHAHRYSETFIKQWIESYENVVNQMLDLDKQLKDIQLVSDAQLKLLNSFNDTESEYDDTQTIENEILEQLVYHPAPTLPMEGSLSTPNSQPKEVPLSYAQMGVYVECMKQPVSTLYNIPSLVRFPKDVDVALLAQAVKTVVKAHPQMQAHFGSSDTETVQMVDLEQPIEIAQSQRTEEEMERYKREFVRPFNLRQGPLYRIEIVTTEQWVYLFVDVHHLVFDGGSFNLFMYQLCDLLDGRTIEPEMFSFADFVAAEKAAESSEKYKEARDFFQERLGNVEGVTEVPSDLTNPIAQGITETVLSKLDFNEIEQFCRSATTRSTPASIAPANDTEKLFCNIFSEILGIDKIGANDNFFDLGGTSLMVTRVIIEADKAGMHVAYGDVFANATPRKLAALATGDTVVSTEEEDVVKFDYSAINKILEDNTLDSFRDGERQGLGRGGTSVENALVLLFRIHLRRAVRPTIARRYRRCDGRPDPLGEDENRHGFQLRGGGEAFQ